MTPTPSRLSPVTTSDVAASLDRLPCSPAFRRDIGSMIRKSRRADGERDLARISADLEDFKRQWRGVKAHPAFGRPQTFRQWRDSMRAMLRRFRETNPNS